MNLSRLKSIIRCGQWRSSLYRWWLRRALSPDMRQWLRLVTPYAAWQEVNLPTLAAERDLRMALAKRSAFLPRISVLMPVYRPALHHLDQAIASVRGQLYDDWQLVIVDDASGDPALDAAIEEAAGDDRRIVQCGHAENMGISATTNVAFERSDGEIILFMDHDDLLSHDCLAEVALFFDAHPECDMVYSDHDKIDGQGRRVSPQFKPGWSPTLLLAYMYMGHVVAVRRPLFERVGGLRRGLEGSQDYDFALRAAEQAQGVGHIPKILYHWRMTPGSTAVSGAEKPGSFAAGIVAVQEAVERRGLAARAFRPDWAQHLHLGLHALEFEAARCVDVVVPVRVQADYGYLSNVISRSVGRLKSLIFVGNDQQLLDKAAEDVRATAAQYGVALKAVLHESDASLSGLYDAGAAAASEGAVLFVTGRFEPRNDNWLDQLAGCLEMQGVGAVGPRLLSVDGPVIGTGLVSPVPSQRPQLAFAGEAAEAPGRLYLSRTAHECLALPAQGLLVHRRLFADLGGFGTGLDDPLEMGLRVSAALRARGWRQLVCADVDVVTVLPASTPALRTSIKDSYYNLNLASEPPLFRPRPWSPPLRTTAPLRVLFASHNLELEGAPLVLHDLVMGLVSAGVVEACVLSPRDGPLAVRYRDLGIDVQLFEMPAMRGATEQFRPCLDRIGAAIERHRADVVLANTLEMTMAVNAAREWSVGAILWHHEAGSWRSMFRRRSKAIRAHALAAIGQAYRTVFVAQATLKKWRAVCMRGNFQLIHHAQPPTAIVERRARWTRAAARAALGLEETEICVLLMGSICARKGQIDLVRAAAALSSGKFDHVRFLIVGPVVQQNYARRFQRELDRLAPDVRSRIEVVGGVSDVALYYRSADIFVCCSRAESAPRVIQEAMSFGLPIVTTPVDGIPEMIGNPANALTYRPSDVRRLAELLVELIESGSKRAELGALAENQLIRLGSYEQMLGDFQELILQAARTSNAPWLTLPVPNE